MWPPATHPIHARTCAIDCGARAGEAAEDSDACADAGAAGGVTGFEDALLPADRFWEVAMSVIDTVQYIPRGDARYSEVGGG